MSEEKSNKLEKSDDRPPLISESERLLKLTLNEIETSSIELVLSQRLEKAEADHKKQENALREQGLDITIDSRTVTFNVTKNPDPDLFIGIQHSDLVDFFQETMIKLNIYNAKYM